MLYLQYLIISFFLILLTRLNQRICVSNGNSFHYKEIGWRFEWFLLTTLYAIRLVDGTAGADSLVYRQAFESGEKIYSEFLFQQLNYFIRGFTDNYHIFFFIIYSVFVFGLLFFVKNLFSKEESLIVLFLFFSMYITAFGVIRQWIGIGIGMIAYTLCVKKEYKKALLISFIGISIHHTILVYFVLIFGYMLIQKFNWKLNYYWLLFTGIAINAMFVLFRTQFVELMRHTEYINYVSNEALSEFSWLGYIPAIVLMVIVLLLSRDIIAEGEEYELGVLFVFANFALIFATVTLGMFRLYVIFFPMRIHMISVLRRVISKKINFGGLRVGTRTLYDGAILFDGLLMMWRVIGASALPYRIDWNIIG